MDLRFNPEDETFREEVATWLDENLSGDFAEVRHRGGSGDQSELFEERREWERHMGENGWSAVGWPKEYGGRGATLAQQVIFAEEYARAGGPGRVGHIGIELAGPTIIAFGTEQQKQRFLPKIISGDELWSQGYSEPNAGSDLANVRTKAWREGNEYVIEGQKIWTSLAQFSDWCFVVCRTEEGSLGHKGLSYILVPLDQEGVDIRPITQLTGDQEFNEVFFDGARTPAENIVGAEGEGWKVAMGTLAFERGASTLGQQMDFRNELYKIIANAKRNGTLQDPIIRQRLADAWIGLKVMRANTLRMLAKAENSELAPEALIYKIFWATWHRKLGELSMDILGADAEIGASAPYTLNGLQKVYLFSRADTIYAGTNQIQRNIIAERALGLPREPRG